jgi:alkylation response protein AidB-like acyl-CoA dehydrogenase
MAASAPRLASLLDSANDLAGRAAAASGEIDRERRLVPELAADMARAGLFRMLVPASLGGSELDFPDYLNIVEVFAKANGSAAWCLNQNNVFATNSTRIPEQAARRIWGDPLAVVSNGPPTPDSLAVPVDGGYRLTGRWDFSSGIRHASWVAALAPVGPSLGSPMTDPDLGVTLLIPRDEVEILDSWNVTGMRGTGSFSFTVNDMFVPTDRSYGGDAAPRDDGPIYLIPTVLMFAAGFGTVALGIARSALDEAIVLTKIKTPVMTKELLADLAATQRQVGQAEAQWAAARALLREAVADLWHGAQTDRQLTVDQRIRLRLAGTHAIRTSADVVDVAYNLAGATSVFADNPIQRRFQDVHVITQQAQGRMVHYDTAGKYFLGQNADGFF